MNKLMEIVKTLLEFNRTIKIIMKMNSIYLKSMKITKLICLIINSINIPNQTLFKTNQL